jgi:DNA polymerase-3 subunit delta
LVGVNPNQLPALLAKSLAPAYLFGGSEPLLLQECRDQVIQAAQQQGFAERNVHEVGRGFDWGELVEDSSALSLFSSRKIIDIRLPTGRPGREGAQVLVEFVESSDPDILLMVSCEKWDSGIRKSKWASVLARAGVLVEIWPVKPSQLPQWIRGRMTASGLDPDPDAVAMLADLVEGNLLAAQQEIDKLVLLKPGEKVSAEDVTRAVANSARFDAFRLVECALLGQLGECLRVASGLQRTGVAIRVWQSRQGPMRQLLRRLTEPALGESFRALALIDRQSKGRAGGDPWQTLDRLLVRLCEPGTVGFD